MRLRRIYSLPLLLRHVFRLTEIPSAISLH
jgi:hypothetical protein